MNRHTTQPMPCPSATTGLNRRRLAAAALMPVSIAAALVTAIGPGAEAASAASPVTLSIEFAAPTPGAINWLGNDVSAYEKLNPSVRFLVADTLSDNDYLAKITSQLSAGTAPDIFSGWTYQRLAPFAKGGRLLNLKPFLDAHPSVKAEISAFALASTTVNGGVYGVPMTSDSEVIYYNKAVFAKAHANVPTTYAAFLSDISKLKGAGYAPIALGNSADWNGSIIYTMLAERLGGYSLYKSVVAGVKPEFNNTAFVKAAGDLQSLVNMGAFNSNYQSESIGYASDLLTANKAGMFINGTWETEDLYKALGKNLGWFSFPTMPGGKDNSTVQMIGLPNNAISISAKTPNETASLAFLTYLMSRPAQVYEAKTGQAIASTYTIPAKDTNPVTSTIHNALSKSATTMAPWDTVLGVALGEEFDNATQALYQGQDPSSVLSSFDDQVRQNNIGA